MMSCQCVCGCTDDTGTRATHGLGRCTQCEMSCYYPGMAIRGPGAPQPHAEQRCHYCGHDVIDDIFLEEHGLASPEWQCRDEYECGDRMDRGPAGCCPACGAYGDGDGVRYEAKWGMSLCRQCHARWVRQLRSATAAVEGYGHHIAVCHQPTGSDL